MLSIRTTSVDSSWTMSKKQQHILESAAICFIKKGFHQTSIRDIAIQANISLGNLYNHFKGKTELISKIALLEAQELYTIEKKLYSQDNPNKAIKEFINDYFDYVVLPENTLLGAEITAEAMRNPSIATQFLQTQNRLAKGITKHLQEGQKQNLFRLNQKEVSFAYMIIDLVERSAQRVAFESFDTKKEMKQNLFHFFDCTLDSK
jgi:AcrR family transcriptional regulator